MDDKEKFMEDTIKLILETDNLRAEMLIIHLAIEQIVNKIIEKNFTNPEYIFKNIYLNSFSSKLDIMASIGIDKNLILNVKGINNIRNIFSHELFSDKNIPNEIEEKIRNIITSIIDRSIEMGITPKKNKSKMIKAPTNIMLSGVGQSIIIEIMSLYFYSNVFPSNIKPSPEMLQEKEGD